MLAYGSPLLEIASSSSEQVDMHLATIIGLSLPVPVFICERIRYRTTSLGLLLKGNLVYMFNVIDGKEEVGAKRSTASLPVSVATKNILAMNGQYIIDDIEMNSTS